MKRTVKVYFNILNKMLDKEEKEPQEGTVEYWNKIRAGLGM